MTTITLSFDNGPDPDVTPQVLDVLHRHDLKATFFVLGDKLRDRRRLSERAHAEGHWIGNHTYNHIIPLGMSAERGMAAAEIEKTEKLIGNLAHERRFFRPFGKGGIIDRDLLNSEALAHLKREAYTCVLWNVIAEDWIHPEGWVDRAIKRCLAEEHALLVLHDLPTGAMRQLDRFISMVKDQGAIFRQDFPTTCVPIERGHAVTSIDEILTKAAA